MVARGLAGAVLLAVPVAVAGAIGFGTGFSGVAGGLSAITSGPKVDPSMVSECRTELAPSRFVQSESEILSSSADSFGAINGLMANTLERLCSAGTSIPRLRTSV